MRTRWILAALISFSLVGCGIGPSGGKKKGKSGQTSGDDQKAAGDAAAEGGGLDSEAAFALTVFPLLQENSCKNCHVNTISPFFAVPDAKQAHDIIITNKKVDLATPSNSRLYLRLAKDSHNCWTADCKADGAKMLAAIEAWSDKMKKKDDGNTGLATATLHFGDAVDKEQGVDRNTIAREAESGTLVAPMRSVVLDTASGGRYIDTPVGAGTPVASNSTTAGRVTYSINVLEAGTYSLWARISSASATQNAFFVRADNGTALNWNMPVTNGMLRWQLVSDQDTGGNVLQFNLTAGTHTIEIRQREPGTRLDMFALSKDPNFRGDELTDPTQGKVLKFPLNDLVNADATFEVEVAKYDAFSFIFKNPTIKTAGKAIKVKGVKILLNGSWDSQAATYTVVDTTVNAPGRVISQAALVMPFVKGFDEDEISVSFDSLTLP